MTEKKETKRKWWTTAELAERWGVHKATVIRLGDMGQLHGIKPGNAYRFSVESVEAYENKTKF